MDLKKLLLLAMQASVNAGKEIMEVYASDFTVEHKSDWSPVTIADKRAHQIIADFLSSTGLPLLSEEGREISYEERKNWTHFWMVDPLDGTKEFIKKNGEFTVNIALIHQQKPLLGIIYIPFTDTLYFASDQMGSFKITGCLTLEFAEWDIVLPKAQQLPLQNQDHFFTVIASRSHNSSETENFIGELKKQHSTIEFISSGSSIKLCLIAEGRADVYPRFAPTMEWDTAAGQAIVEQAGKKVLDYTTNAAMLYNKENLLNGWFIAGS